VRYGGNVKNLIGKIYRELPKLLVLPRAILEMHDLLLSQVRNERKRTLPNHFNRFGRKYFSQSDEDGLTIETVNRLGITNGTFLEFGVGNGLECNSIILLARGWRGVWVGGSKLKFSQNPTWSNFRYIQRWITSQNLSLTCREAASFIGREPDLVSIDLDGNDLIFARSILENGWRPKIFICEFNAKFPLPINFSVQYDDRHKWKHDDYFGSSLQSFLELFQDFDYFLLVVNAATGANAYFVPAEYRYLFPDIPVSDHEKWVEPSYELNRLFLHPTSKKTITQIIDRHST